MNRRVLLQTCATLALTPLAGSLWAAPASNTRLLLVFLRGGYDAANLLVPTSSPFYYEARPTIAVARPGTEPNSALALDGDWGLHPALRDSVYPLFTKGQAAFVPFAGTGDTSRSHFETQDSIELGQPLERSRNYRSGFLNRLAATLGDGGAMSFTDQLPLILQGDLMVPNTALRSLAKPSLDARQSRLIASMYQGTTLAPQVTEGFVVRDDVMREMASEMDAANRNAVSAKGFALEARRIARLMKDKYRIGFVDVGGWDTHVGEGGATGYLAGRLDELGRGLAAFATEMGAEWRDTVTIVVSEFGRTLRENGNRGTDHGHGTVYWLLGGAVRGGKILGEQTRIDPASLFQNRDFPVLNEYRAILGGLFARLYGLNAGQIDRIFPGAKGREMGLV
ncbi:MAG: DUF1501 domain-containing protein [Rhodoferax sp.]|uniref:DUF1501 domain-containing protein n=1 Tax=Rhodoferax sp. TaxID=50421 RepID=UPI002622B52E|nr:DUF1501 domain-containing protein [Rhodoferax sp.]MDD5332350.1 DUF1501 domain-containing protein [Rhodoferax sp.]